MIRNEIFMGTDRSVKGLCRATLAVQGIDTPHNGESNRNGHGAWHGNWTSGGGGGM